MNLFSSYRILAYVVGVLLVVGTVASLCNYLLADGSELQQLGETFSIVWMIHGWVFIGYVIVAFVLSQRAGWSYGFLAVVLLAGLIPVTIFFVERSVERKVRADAPELIRA